MLILNPLYDWSFKYLLDNNQLAKKFLSAMLKENIIHLETRSIELPYFKDGKRFVSRFDFKAVIETKENKTKEVLIEIQKYRHPDPINRFRTYLGENYTKEKTFKDAQGNIRNETLPLIAFYILGYCPEEFDRPYIIVENKIFDGVDDKKLNIYNPIIDLLTHKAIFVTATPPKTYKWKNSRQEAIIRLFQQKMRKQENNTIYELQEEPQDELVKEISEYLNRGTQEEEIRKQLKSEYQYYKSILDLENALIQTKQREEQERRQKEEALIKLAQK